MARPIDFNLAHQLAKQKKLKFHSIVEWEGQQYTIWRDNEGPIYSTKATQGELRLAGARDTVVLHPKYDTITYKVMNRISHDGLIGDFNRTLSRFTQ